MKQSARCLLALAPLLFSGLAAAKDLPNVNAYHAAPKVAAAVSAGQAPAAWASSFDAQRGVPTFLWAARSSGKPGGVVASPSGRTPETAARAHLAAHAARYGLSAEALATARVQQIHDTGRGGIIVVLRQAPGGVDLFHSDVKVMLDRNLELVAIGGNLHASAVAKPKTRGFVLGEAQALAAAFKDLYGLPVGPDAFVDTKQIKADHHYYDLGTSPALKGSYLRFVEPARVKRVYFPMPGALRPAYFVEVLAEKLTEQGSDAYAYVIAADDGSLLYRENLTHNDTFNYRVFADPTGDNRPMDGPIADFSPHPTGMPDGSYPAFATPNLISIDGFNKFHDPWLPAGAMVSTGNNVDAYTDDDKPDGFSGGSDIRATTTSANTFDRTYDTSLGPQSSDDQRMAAITDLFYVTNWLHDWWYDSGFDEAAGNAQANNLGRGGVGGDPLHAEAQDGAPNQRNNSNMSAMSDGASPRMQMYVWDGVGSSTLAVTPGNQDLTHDVAQFGPQTFDLMGTVALANDNTGTATDACETVDSGVSGKIALVDRGTCSFKTKAQHVQQAGAVGMILADQMAGEPPPFLAGNPGGTAVTIPSLSISLADGNALKAALMSGPVTATMTRAQAADRDGTIDNTVVAHEWGHYLHLRQVGCASQACGAESEGWGDFNALLMVVREGDNLDGAFAMAQYATVSFPDDPAYFGIRRFPYSVDFTKNPLTFKDISDGSTLPTSAPIAQSTAQINNSEVHAAGEIWASMLFESLVAILKKSQGSTPAYTFAEARRRMTDYIEGGLKMAPVDPTYTEQRDAILAAAAAADADDLSELAKAFARRGAGTCAVSPARDSTDLSGVVESFTVQPNVAVLSLHLDDSVKSCDHDGHLDAGETGTITVKVMNTGTAMLPNATATVATTAPGVTFPNGPTLSFGDLSPLGSASATIDVALDAGLTKMATVDFKVALDGVMSCPGEGTLETAPLTNYDEVPMSSKVDTVEAVQTVWKKTGMDADTIWSRSEPTPGNHVWAGIDYSSPSDTSLTSPSLQVSATDKLVLTFDHRHSFEQSMGVNWDGSVIEISPDDGASWNDISMYADPGYGGTIGDPQAQAMNVLRNRQGYIGQNKAWPMTETVTIDLGTAFAGKTVRVRFRIGTDDAQGDNGWELDNIKLDGITNTPFPALIDDATPCGTPAEPDAGAGGGPEKGMDGGVMADAGTDGGQEMEVAFGGCGCRTSGEGGNAGGAAAALLALAGLLGRRRRR